MQATKEQEFQKQAAAVAAAASSSKTGNSSKGSQFVTIRNVATTAFGSATTVVPRLDIPDGVGEPVAVHGGILLGVSVSGGAAKEVDKLLLYDWNGGLLTSGMRLKLQRTIVHCTLYHYTIWSGAKALNLSLIHI